MSQNLVQLRDETLKLFEMILEEHGAIYNPERLIKLLELNFFLDEIERRIAAENGTEFKKKTGVAVFSIYSSGRNFLLQMLERALQDLGYFNQDAMFGYYGPNVPDRVITSMHPARLAESEIGETIASGMCNHLKMIFIYRDLRDVVLSTAMAHKKDGIRISSDLSDEEAIRVTIDPDFKVIRTELGDWKGSKTAAEDILFYLSQPMIYKIRFEELKSNTRAEMTKLLTFLGRNVDEATLDEIVDAGSLKHAPQNSFRGGRLGEWRTALSSVNKDLLKKTTGEKMLEIGMVSDLDW